MSFESANQSSVLHHSLCGTVRSARHVNQQVKIQCTPLLSLWYRKESMSFESASQSSVLHHSHCGTVMSARHSNQQIKVQCYIIHSLFSILFVIP